MSSPAAPPRMLLHPDSVRDVAGDPQGPCLVGCRCGECALVVFPAMPVCPRCGSDGAMREVELGRKATLYSHSIARVAPQGFAAPYYQAFVELPEGPRVFTLIGDDVEVRPDRLVDGQAMRLIVEPLSSTPEKRGVLTYKYVPEDRHA